MNYLKYLKYLVLAWLTLTVLFCIGGIVKYNMDMNAYIGQEGSKSTTSSKDVLRQGTEIYLLGTVHFETTSIKRDDIFKTLEQISPSVILYESDAKTVSKMLKRTDFFRQLMSTFKKGNSVESFVTLRYLEQNPKCVVYGYDWEERDAFQLKHNLSSTSNDLINSILRINSQNVLTNEQSASVKEFVKINKAYNALGASKSLGAVNNRTTDSIIRKRQFYMYKTLPEIAMTIKDLENFRDFIPIHMEYWDLRNEAMAKNIIEQIKQYPNKKIVVLNGYSHRYFLYDLLKPHQSELNFTIKEF